MKTARDKKGRFTKYYNLLYPHQGGMKGRKHTEATKLKIKLANIKSHSWRKGKKLPPETVEKIRLAKVGKNHPNWKGGITSISAKLRNGVKMVKWSKTVKKRDKYKCIWCGSKEDLESDHIKSFKDYPKLRLRVSNGRTLCHKCHVKTDNYGGRGKKKSIN